MLKSVLQNSTINPEVQDYYYISPAQSSIFTYMLPMITCDGMRFTITRGDTDGTSFLKVESISPILVNNELVTSVNINPLSSVIFISSNYTWYTVQYNTRTINSISSTSFVSNSGNPYKRFKTNSVIARTYLPWTSITKILMVASTIGNPSFSVIDNNGNIVLNNVSFTTNGNIETITFTGFTNLSIMASVLTLVINTNISVDIYSIGIF